METILKNCIWLVFHDGPLLQRNFVANSVQGAKGPERKEEGGVAGLSGGGALLKKARWAI